MKKISCLILALLLPFLFSACKNPIIMARSPFRQEDTKWASDDGTINFYVDSDRKATGEMVVDGECIEFYITDNMAAEISIYDKRVLDDEFIKEEDMYENWICSYKSKDRFVATVEKTTYFKVGQKISFKKIKE